MKIVTTIVALLGVVALVLGIFEHLHPVLILSMSPGGYLRGAMALYLLAIMLMVYSRTYCCCCEKKDAAPAEK
jgi:hypothetical protein